jgi:hypothetical protein
MAALAQPPHLLVALSPRPATPHPYPSPPLGFAERGEGGAGADMVSESDSLVATARAPSFSRPERPEAWRRVVQACPQG